LASGHQVLVLVTDKSLHAELVENRTEAKRGEPWRYMCQMNDFEVNAGVVPRLLLWKCQFMVSASITRPL